MDRPKVGQRGRRSAIVDALIILERRVLAVRGYRTLVVSKLRGSDALHGRHAFDICSDGIRTEPDGTR